MKYLDCIYYMTILGAIAKDELNWKKKKLLLNLTRDVFAQNKRIFRTDGWIDEWVTDWLNEWIDGWMVNMLWLDCWM